MNVSSPWSRRVCTQPASVTSFPASEARASPQVCVRNTYLVPPNLSASGLEPRSRLVVSLVTAEPLLARSIPIVLEEWRLAGCSRLVLVGVGGALEERRRHVLRHVAADLGHDGREPRDALRLGDEVADDHVAAARLGCTADDRDLRAVLHGALELLVERPVRIVDRDGEPGLPKWIRDLQPIGAVAFFRRQDIHVRFGLASHPNPLLVQR